MDKLALQKYETQLANIWRLWSQARRFSKLLMATDLRNVGNIIQMGNMFLSNRKFWATNNPRFLSSALKSYFSLRGHWLSEFNDWPNPVLEVSGWADKDTFLKMRETLSAQRIRKVFRPDIWYLRGCKGSFFTGFIFKIGVSDLAGITQELESSLPNFQIQLREGSVNKIGDKFAGQLESINPVLQKRGVNWFSTFSVSPREFTWLVETAADKEVSKMALSTLSFYKQFGGFELQGEGLSSMAKFCLILGEIPPGISVPGWSLTPIIKPAWTDTQASEGENDERRYSRVTPKYAQLEDVKVTNGGVLLTGSGFVDWDSAQSPNLDFVAGNWANVIGTNANLNMCFIANSKPGETFEEAILLGSRADSNWFHFLIETLPRILFVENHVDGSVPVLISNRVPSSGVEALKVLTDRNIIQIDTNTSTLVKRAYVPGPVIFHPDTQFMWDSKEIDDVNQDILGRFREKIIERIKPEGDPQKLFFPRPGNARIAANSNQIGRILSERGFTTVNIGSLSFAEQVKLLGKCEALVTEGGASMSNFIFLPEGSKVLVLMSDISSSYKMPKLLGSVSRSDVRILGGRRIRGGFGLPLSAKLHSSYLINLREFKKLIAETLSR